MLLNTTPLQVVQQRPPSQQTLQSHNQLQRPQWTLAYIIQMKSQALEHVTWNQSYRKEEMNKKAWGMTPTKVGYCTKVG